MPANKKENRKEMMLRPSKIGRPTEYHSEIQRKKAKQQSARDYRKHTNKKRVEVWIANPDHLELLKQYSELNQTQVINQLINMVACGVSEENWINSITQEKKDQLMEQQIDRMIGELLNVFQKLKR